MEYFLFEIGWLSFGFFDLLEILIIGYLIYLVHRLLRGSVAFNIFIGIVILFMLWWLVKAFKMELLSAILGQFASVGVVIIAIVFQPELRRFLLVLGNQTLKNRLYLFKFTQEKKEASPIGDILRETLLELSAAQTGGLIVVAKDNQLQQVAETGVKIDAIINKSLIISIFNKESPLHDGAILIYDNRLQAASCILPLSDSQALPAEAGTRHRAGVGITETADVKSFIVSEENGAISFAHQGQLRMHLSETELEALIRHL